ncbi:MAG: ABC transporter ATP-binding protein [Anaerolineales bacterium]
MSEQDGLDIKNFISSNRLQSLWNMMQGYRKTYLLATLSLGIAAAARSGTYLLLGHFADQLLSTANIRRVILWIALGFLGLAVIQGLSTFLSGKLAAETSEGITRRLRNFLFDHIQHLSFAYHDRMNTGELIQRTTSDVDALRRFFADQAIGAGRIVMLFVVNLAALITLNTRLALFSIVIVPFTIALSIFFFRKVSEAYEEYQDQEALLSNTLQENLTGVRVVKAFARQKYEEEKFDRDNWKKFLKGKKLLTMHSLYWPVSDILTGGQMLAGFYLGARMAIQGVISIGTYMAYAGMIIWIIWPIRNMGRLIVQMSSGLVSFERILKVIKEEREPLSSGDYLPANGKIRGDIRFENVSFAYAEGPTVLKDISFHCKPGQIIALLGGTGSGKSTLVNLLPRFYDYTHGKLYLDGVDLKRYPRRFLRRQIGLVEQEPFLFSRTIRKNITYGVDRQVPEEEFIAASKAAAIHEVIMKFPNGYETLVGEKGVNLSGGQKQRVAIARTLLKNPKILILDDATSSVDVETEAEIHLALENLMRDRTTFIIAHRIHSLMRADKILVLDQGRIIQEGTHEELLSVPGKYQEIFEIQAKIDDALQEELGLEGHPGAVIR